MVLSSALPLRQALGLAVVAGGLLVGSPASAQPRNSPAVEASLRARSAYEAGRFREAVALYREAYGHKADPTLLFNLARCYEALATEADLQASIEAYEGYLRARPNASDHAAVERRIAVLREQTKLLDEARKAKERPATQPEPTLAPPETRTDAPASPQPGRPARGSVGVVPIVLIAVGAGALGTGGVLGALARGHRQAALDETSGTAAAARVSEAESFAFAANVAFVGGSVLAAAGGTWALIAWSRGSPQPASAHLRLVPGGAIVEGRF